MKRVQLLQIGDIHYPQAKAETLGDLKDAGFPHALGKVVAAKPLQLVMRAIRSLCDDGIDGILFCGDLTSTGSIENYRACAEYLDKILELSAHDKWPIGRVHVVPGNHDVNRDFCDADGEDLYKKFAPLVTAWADLDIPVLCTKNARSAEIISDSNSRVVVFSLNSCLGCGERRFLPEHVRDRLRRLLDAALSQMETGRAFDLIGEQLDTPAFSIEDIDCVCDGLKRLDGRAIPVILTHHNLLPQTIPRISIYTEVINSGLVRSRLLACNKPVIYCHGHVHEYHIEIVRLPDRAAYPLVCISAPILSRGFNLLTIEFGRAGAPMGCIVTPYCLQNDGSVSELKKTRVAFHTVGTADRVLHKDTWAIIPLISTEFSRFDDLHKAVSGRFRDMQSKTLCDSLIEAEWVGFVEIHNRDESHRDWHVRRIGT